MEVAVADISQEISSCNEIQSEPTPMEVELDTHLDHTQEISPTANDEELAENKEEALEPGNEKPSAENEENEEESKEKVLKGILKYEHIYGLDKKSVDFDLDIQLIPFDNKVYTVDIQIVKELPKKIVSYRELFKKMAEEEKAAKERAAKGESAKEAEDDDDEEEIEDTKAFSHLVIKEPPVHHSANDIDVGSYKALKAATVQNEKNEDFQNTCHSDVSQKEEENSLTKDLDNSFIVENGKFSLEDIIEDSSNNNALLTEVAKEISSNQTLKESSREISSPNEIIINKNIENTVLSDTLTKEESQNEITHERKNKKEGNQLETNFKHLNGNLEEIDNDMDVDELLNCSHDYIYSDYNEAEETSEIMDYKLATNNNDPQSISNEESSISISPSREDNFSLPSIILQNGPQEHFHENSSETWNNHEIDVSDILNDSQDFKSKHLNADINAIVPNSLLQDKHHKVTLESIKEERSFNSSREDLNISPNLGTATNALNNVKVNVDRVIENETVKREIGVQTEFDFTNPSNGLLCSCCLNPKSNVEEQNMDRFQNTNIPSLNSDDSIAMLASDLDLDCQEDKSATESSEGNFRDFTQSTSLDFSSSLSMESFEMDDTSIRIEIENGCPSNNNI